MYRATKARSSNAHAQWRRKRQRQQERQLQQQQQQALQQQQLHKQPAQSQSLSLPPRQKCGVVYTWNCEIDAGVLDTYAVECGLCEDRPLCRLSEFAEHMDIWHTTEWAQQPHSELDNHREEQVSFAYHGILPMEWSVHSSDRASIYSSMESLAPFEQVLIALDAKEMEAVIMAETDDLQFMTEEEEMLEEEREEELEQEQQQEVEQKMPSYNRDFSRGEAAQLAVYYGKAIAAEHQKKKQQEGTTEHDENNKTDTFQIGKDKTTKDEIEHEHELVKDETIMQNDKALEYNDTTIDVEETVTNNAQENKMKKDKGKQNKISIDRKEQDYIEHERQGAEENEIVVTEQNVIKKNIEDNNGEEDDVGTDKKEMKNAIDQNLTVKNDIDKNVTGKNEIRRDEKEEQAEKDYNKIEKNVIEKNITEKNLVGENEIDRDEVDEDVGTENKETENNVIQKNITEKNEFKRSRIKSDKVEKYESEKIKITTDKIEKDKVEKYEVERDKGVDDVGREQRETEEKETQKNVIEKNKIEMYEIKKDRIEKDASREHEIYNNEIGKDTTGKHKIERENIVEKNKIQKNKIEKNEGKNNKIKNNREMNEKDKNEIGTNKKMTNKVEKNARETNKLETNEGENNESEKNKIETEEKIAEINNDRIKKNTKVKHVKQSADETEEGDTIAHKINSIYTNDKILPTDKGNQEAARIKIAKEGDTKAPCHVKHEEHANRKNDNEVTESKAREFRSRKCKLKKTEAALEEQLMQDAKIYHIQDADFIIRNKLDEERTNKVIQQVAENEGTPHELETMQKSTDEEEKENENDIIKEIEGDEEDEHDHESLPEIEEERNKDEGKIQQEVGRQDEHDENEIMQEIQEEQQNDNSIRQTEEASSENEDKRLNQPLLQDLADLNVTQQIEYGLKKRFANPKLTPADSSKLIALYSKHPILWNQTHPQYNDAQLSRKSWQAITRKWNHLQRQHQFTTNEVRARISLLCQRYIRERERLNLEGGNAAQARYAHYKQLQFLDAVKPLQNRRQLFEEQNVKLLDYYRQFPVLWHSAHRHSRQPEQREQAVRHISTALKLSGIHLTPCALRQRLQALRKFYRLERMQHLQFRLERKSFDAKFKYYERMQFLDKHIDPYVCDGCGKIYETLQIFREHSGSLACTAVLEQIDGQSGGVELEPELEKVEKIGEKMVLRSAKRKENQEASIFEEDFGIVDDISISTFSLPQDTFVPTDTVEIDGIFDNIIENLPCGKSTLSDSAIEMSIETLSHKSGSDANDNCTGRISDELDRELDIILQSLEVPMETMHKSNNNFSVGNVQTEAAVESILAADSVEFNGKATHANSKAMNAVENNFPTDLVVKIQCENFSYDLKLDSNELSTVELTDLATAEPKENKTVSKRKWKKQQISYGRLTTEHTRTLITLYRQHPQLWNQHHMDYNSRKLRHIAWRSLTTKQNKMLKTRYSSNLLQRKLIDFVKYYKREKQRIEQEHSCTKWNFYDDFSFMDEVLAPNCEMEKTLQLRRKHMQIIEMYKTYPQLWDTNHTDYSKRKQRQRQFDDMCQRLQADGQLSITAEKLKQCLIELRSNYRAEKQRRMRALKRQEQHTASYEYYEALAFLDLHVSPFACGFCTMSFKKLSDFTQHARKQHGIGKQGRSRHSSKNTGTQAVVALEHVCHICGITFTLRNNLVCHLKRHFCKATHACSICPKTFFSSTALRVHERYHNKEYPYMCENCGLSYVNASKLNQHMKRHRNQRDYACSKCERAYFTAFDRDRHERRHMNIRDKVCTICGKAFFGGSAYYAHLMLHSGVKRFACDMCDQRFAQYAGLYKHRKKYHPTETVQENVQD